MFSCHFHNVERQVERSGTEILCATVDTFCFYYVNMNCCVTYTPDCSPCD